MLVCLIGHMSWFSQVDERLIVLLTHLKVTHMFQTNLSSYESLDRCHGNGLWMSTQHKIDSSFNIKVCLNILCFCLYIFNYVSHQSHVYICNSLLWFRRIYLELEYVMVFILDQGLMRRWMKFKFLQLHVNFIRVNLAYFFFVTATY